MPDIAPPMPLPDALRRLAAHRDPDAWDALLHHCAEEIHRITRRILSDAALADDACQETLLQIRTHASSFNAPPQPAHAQLAARVWIMRIAANCALRMARSRTRTLRREALAADSRPPAETPSPDACRLKEEQAERVRREVAGLPDTLRDPVALRFFAEMDYADIAEALACSPAAVKKRVERGLDRLRTRLALLGLVLSLSDLDGHLSGGTAHAAESVSAAQNTAWKALLKSPGLPAFSSAVPVTGLSILVKLLLGSAALLFVGACAVGGYYYAINAQDSVQVAAAPPPTPAASATASPAPLNQQPPADDLPQRPPANPFVKRLIFVPKKGGPGAGHSRLVPGPNPGSLWLHASAGIGDKFPVSDEQDKHHFDVLVESGNDDYLAVKIFSTEGAQTLDLIRDKPAPVKVAGVDYLICYPTIEVNLDAESTTNQAHIIVEKPARPPENPLIKHPVPSIASLVESVENAERKLHVLHVNGEIMCERWQKTEHKWDYGGECSAEAWTLGKPGSKARIDIKKEVVPWIDGPAPYGESVESFGYDGRIGKTLVRAAGVRGSPVAVLNGRIVSKRPSGLSSQNAMGWSFSIYGVQNLNRFSERLKGESSLSRLSLVSVETGGKSLIEVVIGENKGDATSKYLLDPLRGWALLSGQEIYKGVVIKQFEVDELASPAPDIYYPIKVHFAEYELDGTPKSKSVFEAKSVEANMPGFDERVFNLDFPAGTKVTDEIKNSEYFVAEPD